MLAWRQLQLNAEQHKQLMLSTPQMASAGGSSSGGSLLTLQDMMLKHHNSFVKRRLSEDELDGDNKMPKLTPINTCSSAALPLSLASMPLMSSPYYGDSSLNDTTSAAAAGAFGMSHREKLQNQQYLDRLRRMNERGKERMARSRVNFEPSNVAKTVREELACRKQQSKKGKPFFSLERERLSPCKSHLTSRALISSSTAKNFSTSIEVSSKQAWRE
jgi:hypothetical protein